MLRFDSAALLSMIVHHYLCAGRNEKLLCELQGTFERCAAFKPYCGPEIWEAKKTAERDR